MPRSIVYPAAIPMMTLETKKKLLFRKMSSGVGLIQMATTS